MNKPQYIFFLINLLQDVNVVRPLVYLAAEETDAKLVILVAEAFRTRDKGQQWLFELDRIRADTGAAIEIYSTDYDAYRHLEGRCGIIIAGSESDLGAHAITHNVFRIAPPDYLRVTLQHGFECVGFLQNYEQTAVHGHYVGFGADVICGWADQATLRSIAPSERSKLYVTGPQLLIQPGSRKSDLPPQVEGGLVCENLHSVRLNVSQNFKGPFMRDFFAFCRHLEQEGKQVTMRPHPGGQYVVRNNVPLPPNVAINNLPIYDVDLTRYAYGISAPSSVLIDMLLANIPTAVWRDPDGLIDASNYGALPQIGDVQDWIEFTREATEDPDAARKRQRQFLESLRMPLNPRIIRERFSRLLAGTVGPAMVSNDRSTDRVLMIANGEVPSLHISFVKPLADHVASRRIRTLTLTEAAIATRFEDPEGPEAEAWVLEQITSFDPSMIIACRYSGPHADAISSLAEARGIPKVYHLDDDLLNIPIELGERKYKFHNDPRRLHSVSTQIRRADLVYCSTRPLLERIRSYGLSERLVAGDIYCSGSVLTPAEERPVRTIGYMGYDHAHDLELELPALVEVLERHQHLQFQLFGSIPKPPVLDRFGDRVTVIPPIPDYSDFIDFFGRIGWDIGICPLADTPFNEVKADTKWVEYTAAGIAVVATGGMMYDACCADGCGLLANSHKQWVAAIEKLCADPKERFAQVARAQRKLARDYTIDRLRDQVDAVLAEARRRSLGKAA